MEIKSKDSVRVSLMEMVRYCREIRILLDNDITSFSTDNLEALEVNNKKKSDVIERLNSMAKALHKNDVENDAELSGIVNELKMEVKDCFKSIVMNNNIVNANMNQLREIWDKVLSHKQSTEGLYDNAGCTLK